MNHEIIRNLLTNYINAYIRVYDEDSEFVSQWDHDALEKAENAILAEFDKVKFSPLGDNHHNAVACPYCNPSAR